jgi:hypothetical protein
MNQEPPKVYIEKRVKNTKQGPHTYEYWVAAWRISVNGRSRPKNVYLGTVSKMSIGEALEKACRLKLGSTSVGTKPSVTSHRIKTAKAARERYLAKTIIPLGWPHYNRRIWGDCYRYSRAGDETPA